MRTQSVLSSRLARALFLSASLIAVAGCGGGGANSGTSPVPFGNGSGICDPGTNVSLAFPNNTPGNFPTGVSTGIGRVEIVANGNNNTLGQSYAQFDTILVPNFGGQVQGGFLTLTSDGGGPHPYTSDFYYNSAIGGLQSGVTYTVYLNVPSSANCVPVAIGQFST